MKRAGKFYIITASLFACIFTAANLFFGTLSNKQEEDIYVLMNRVFSEIEVACEAYSADELTEETVTSVIKDVYYLHTSDYASEYGALSLPKRVYYISAEYSDTGVTLLNRDKEFEKVWMLAHDGKVQGFVVFEFAESGYVSLHIMLNVVIAACFTIALAICIYINSYVFFDHTLLILIFSFFITHSYKLIFKQLQILLSIINTSAISLSTES